MKINEELVARPEAFRFYLNLLESLAVMDPAEVGRVICLNVAVMLRRSRMAYKFWVCV